MHVESRKEPWTHRVRPLLPVVLSIQAGLLGLGVASALAMPDGAVWGVLASLVGSALNLGLFVALLYRRLRAVPSAASERQGEPLHPADDAEPDLSRPGEEQLRRRLQGLEDDLALRERRLDRLQAGRDRAREESRLKSDYLALLGRELQPMLERLDAWLTPGAAASRDDGRRMVEELRSRLGDLAELLASLSGDDAAAPTGARTSRVLIVDDGPVNLMLARQVLERQGLEVSTATSGAEALACLSQAPFDLVLMDIFMPDMDGMETSRRWREEEASRYPGKRSILVALTANASGDDRRRFLAAGMDDYLAKPYRPQALVDRVRRWLPDHFLPGEAP